MKLHKIIQILSIVYGLVLVIENYAVATENRSLELLIKPFLMIILVVYYLVACKKVNYWYLLILFLSLIGDYCFIYRDTFEHLFVGLLVFSLCHLIYIKILSEKSIKKISLGSAIISSLPFLFCIGLVFYLVSPKLDAVFYPSLFHMITVSMLCVLVFQNYLHSNTKESLLMFIGVFLFIVANCLFGIYRFYDSLPVFLVIVTSLYAIAQYVVCRAMVLRSYRIELRRK